MWKMRQNIEDDEDFLILGAGYIYLQQKNKVNNKRRFWVRPTLQKRNVLGVDQLIMNLQDDDVGLNGELRSSFKNFLRMSSEDYENLICLVGPAIKKEDTNWRRAISINERLALTLRFLATGDSYHSLMYQFRISTQSISLIVPEVCEAIINALSGYIKMPSNEDEWKNIARDYDKIWNFPHCVGAMDGKHIVIESPILSGSEFFNYKGSFSVVLFAIVDANYNFIYVSVGCQGRISDGGVFKSTNFRKLMQNCKLNLPAKSVLPGRSILSPYVFVADDAFPLSPCVLKPYSGHQDRGSKNRIFNYRLSRARRVVENVFGIMASIFRVFRKPMLLQPEKVEKVVLACVHLHNYLRKSSSSKNIYSPPGAFDSEQIDSGTIERGTWRKDQLNSQSFLSINQIARKSSIEAAEVRNEFAEYFISEQGQVPWQLNYC